MDVYKLTKVNVYTNVKINLKCTLKGANLKKEQNRLKTGFKIAIRTGL